MYNTAVTTFREYLLQKLQEYETKQGRRITLDTFAEYLGVKRPILSLWLSGKNNPSLDSVKTLAEKLGPEIYDVLTLPKPENLLLDKLSRVFMKLSDDDQQRLIEDAERLAAENNERRIRNSGKKRKTAKNH